MKGELSMEKLTKNEVIQRCVLDPDFFGDLLNEGEAAFEKHGIEFDEMEKEWFVALFTQNPEININLLDIIQFGHDLRREPPPPPPDWEAWPWTRIFG